MEVYSLKDTPSNRAEYDNFLRQYKAFEALENKDADIEAYLANRKYQLKVKWEAVKPVISKVDTGEVIKESPKLEEVLTAVKDVKTNSKNKAKNTNSK